MKKSLVFSLIAVITVGFGYFVLKNAPAEKSQLQKDFEIKISVGRENLQNKIISKANTQSISDIDEINRFYLDLVRELQKNLGPNPSDKERQQIHEIHTEIFQALDDDIRAYLGADRFEWMKKARTEFNKAFSKHHNSSSEMLAW